MLGDIIICAKLEMFGEDTDYSKGFITGLKYAEDSMANLDELEKIMEGDNEHIANESH